MHRPAATPALLGRQAELARARELVARAAAGQGGLLLIEGSAGIGKTRLLREIAAAAREAGLEVLAARAGELEQRFAFGVVRQAVEPTLEALNATAREQLLDGVV